MNQTMRAFFPAIVFTVICLILAAWYGMGEGRSIATVMTLVVVLCILEISLSFDNAVVNATVLQHMDEHWRRIFLTWGILIAVFGMRLVFPIVIVAVAANISPLSVIDMALERPDDYAKQISSSRVQVSSLGGMFLLLVFLTFFFDGKKTHHWLGPAEQALARIGKLESVEIIIALVTLLVLQSFLPAEVRALALSYGIAGIALYVGVDSLSTLLSPEAAQGAKRSGAAGFLYLEILDASFSFDGVLGAFAITTNIVIITLGLAVGAMFVRNITIYLVEQGTLDKYTFLEHGAHYAIGALAIIMLMTMMIEVHELITGLVGVTFIGLSIFSSIRHRRQVRRALQQHG